MENNTTGYSIQHPCRVVSRESEREDRKMNTYRVKKINLSKVNTIEEYWKAVNRATVVYCTGIAELSEYCGGRLHRERCGYAGRNGNIEYVAERVK